MEKVDVVIVGAGVIGLAVACKLGKERKEVVVIERHKNFGQETSSRNSEVIHAGIYYSKDSLKARLCLEGNKLLYHLCERHNIPHKRLGKLIVATNEFEVKELEELITRGKNNGVEGLTLLTETQIKEMEPYVQAICAIHSPNTGIVDTHQLMRCLESLAKDKGVIFAYNCEIVGIERKQGGYEVNIRDADGQKLVLFTQVFINSAGLHSDEIAQMVGIDIEKAGYRLHYSKGEYFRVKESKSKLVKQLVYPTPKDSDLGIHTVTDLQGQLKLGPNAFYVDEVNYDVDILHLPEFYESSRKFLPFIELEDLNPDMAGIRPKLQRHQDSTEDFIISDEEPKGFPHFINLIGIDSPGLTASLAIAKYVNTMI